MAIQASKICKIWILLNPSMCYSGCFWDTGRYFTTFWMFLQSFLKDSVVIFYCFLTEIFLPLLPAAFPPFYIVILESQGTIDSSVLLPGYQSLFCARHPESWAFPCFSYFPSFDVVSLKAHGWLSILRRARSSKPLMIQFFGCPSSLSFFPKWAESISVGLKVFAATSLFISSHSGFSRYRSPASWMVTLKLLAFLAASGAREGYFPPSFLVFLLAFSCELS